MEDDRHIHQSKPLKNLDGQICQICGDTVGVTSDGGVFVACNECTFPVCRPCYEYERKDGNQCCPQCKTRYKRQKGSPRVEGDDEEDDVDDLENEFNYTKGTSKARNEWQGEDVDLSSSSRHGSQPIPLLTNGQVWLVKKLVLSFPNRGTLKGHLMAKTITKRVFFQGTRLQFTLNPGPFNVKEHVLITIFANSGAGSVYATHILSVVKLFYKRKLTLPPAVLVMLTTQLLGFGWAGLFQKYLVEPAEMWWPANLVQVSIFR